MGSASPVFAPGNGSGSYVIAPSSHLIKNNGTVGYRRFAYVFGTPRLADIDLSLSAWAGARFQLQIIFSASVPNNKLP